MPYRSFVTVIMANNEVLFGGNCNCLSKASFPLYSMRIHRTSCKTSPSFEQSSSNEYGSQRRNLMQQWRKTPIVAFSSIEACLSCCYNKFQTMGEELKETILKCRKMGGSNKPRCEKMETRKQSAYIHISSCLCYVNAVREQLSPGSIILIDLKQPTKKPGADSLCGTTAALSFCERVRIAKQSMSVSRRIRF